MDTHTCIFCSIQVDFPDLTYVVHETANNDSVHIWLCKKCVREKIDSTDTKCDQCKYGHFEFFTPSGESGLISFYDYNVNHYTRDLSIISCPTCYDIVYCKCIVIHEWRCKTCNIQLSQKYCPECVDIFLFDVETYVPRPSFITGCKDHYHGGGKATKHANEDE